MPALSQQTGDQTNESVFLYYTYIGPVFSAGHTTESRKNWNEVSGVETDNISGPAFSGGVSLNVFTKNMSGEFTMQYARYTGDIKSGHMYFTSAFKYYYELNERFSVYPGLGVYLEMPPSTGIQKGGAGFYVPAGVLINLTDTIRLYTEGYFKYGYLSSSGESRSAYGGNIGVLFPVGNI